MNYFYCSLIVSKSLATILDACDVLAAIHVSFIIRYIVIIACWGMHEVNNDSGICVQ